MNRLLSTLILLLAMGSSLSAQEQPATSDSAGAQKPKNKIEIINGNYVINGLGAHQKHVDELLSQSKNPAIALQLKAAKVSAKAQKIIKITSYPTTIIGSAGTLFLSVDFISDLRRHRDNTGTYLGFFSSLLGTISMPITNKIMAAKNKKTYSKLITMYNVTN